MPVDEFVSVVRAVFVVELTEEYVPLEALLFSLPEVVLFSFLKLALDLLRKSFRNEGAISSSITFSIPN